MGGHALGGDLLKETIDFSRFQQSDSDLFYDALVIVYYALSIVVSIESTILSVMNNISSPLVTFFTYFSEKQLLNTFNPTILSIALVAMDILSWATFILQGSMFLSFLGYTAIINQINFGSLSSEVRTMHMLQQMVGTLGP
jgi:hypothetical protein